jgi:hypothetical protein
MNIDKSYHFTKFKHRNRCSHGTVHERHERLCKDAITFLGAYTYEVNKSVIETLILEGGDLMKNMKTILWETAWSRKFSIPA